MKLLTGSVGFGAHKLGQEKKTPGY